MPSESIDDTLKKGTTTHKKTYLALVMIPITLSSCGGAGSVDNCHTPNGFTFTTSSLDVVGTTDDMGNYIENDDGIPVDFKIDPSIWYNRKALGEVLDAQYPLTR